MNATKYGKTDTKIVDSLPVAFAEVPAARKEVGVEIDKYKAPENPASECEENHDNGSNGVLSAAEAK